MEEKKEKNKLMSFISYWWEKEAIRFIFVGGINTVVGILFTMLLRFIFNKVQWNPEILVIYYETGKGLVTTKTDTQVLFVDVPYLLNFILLLPFAYTTQTKIAFRTPWSIKRFLRYPLSSIPNLILTSLFICLFSGILHLNSYISYILAPVLALPIMFFIIRFLVKPIQVKKGNQNEESEK